MRVSRDSLRRSVAADEPRAVFENPLTMARGQQQIADIFCLLGLIPGQRWSELGDVAEAQTYGQSAVQIAIPARF